MISFVIPTFNEESHIGDALQSIEAACSVPHEIIVADHASTDETRRIASESACLVTEGGLPAVGRNAGARLARHELIVFLDADSRYSAVVESAILSRLDTHDALSFPISPLPSERSLLTRFCCRVANAYINLRNRMGFPIGWGACLFVKRSAFATCGGFREDLLRFEDFEFIGRVAKTAKYEFVRQVSVETSSRRLIQGGLLRYVMLCVVPEICRHLVGWPTKKIGRWMGYDDWHQES